MNVDLTFLRPRLRRDPSEALFARADSGKSSSEASSESLPSSCAEPRFRLLVPAAGAADATAGLAVALMARFLFFWGG